MESHVGLLLWNAAVLLKWINPCEDPSKKHGAELSRELLLIEMNAAESRVWLIVQ